MNFLSLFFEVPFFAVGVAVVILFIAGASAFFAFVMLRKTFKMAIRFLIVAVIMVIAVVGSLSFLWFSSGSTPKQRPPAPRKR